LVGDLEDPGKLMELAERSDVVTFRTGKNISGAALAPLEKTTTIRPAAQGARNLAGSAVGKSAVFKSLEIPVAAHAAVDSKEDLVRCGSSAGNPRRASRPGAWATTARAVCPRASRRLSMPPGRTSAHPGSSTNNSRDFPAKSPSSVRARRRVRSLYYPLSSNTHSGGVLRYSVAPFINRALERTARRYLKKTHGEPRVRGCFDHRIFIVKGRLIANENGTARPQFRPLDHRWMHYQSSSRINLRAICDLPLGSTPRPRSYRDDQFFGPDAAR